MVPRVLWVKLDCKVSRAHLEVREKVELLVFQDLLVVLETEDHLEIFPRSLDL